MCIYLRNYVCENNSDVFKFNVFKIRANLLFHRCARLKIFFYTMTNHLNIERIRCKSVVNSISSHK